MALVLRRPTPGAVRCPVVRKGMTLIELLVAMLITSIVLAAGYGMLDQMHRTNVSDGIGSTLADAELRHDLRSWLASTRTTLDGDMHPFIGTGDPNAQIETLVAAARPYADRPAIARLSVDRDPVTTERGLKTAFTDPVDASRRTIELDSSIASMSTRFLLTEDMDQAARVWLDDYTSTLNPPQAIEIRFDTAPDESLPRLLQLPVLVARDRQ